MRRPTLLQIEFAILLGLAIYAFGYPLVQYGSRLIHLTP